MNVVPVRGVGSVGFRTLLQHRGRTVLTIAGAALGVAMFVGTIVTTATASGGLDEFLAEATGQADVVVTPPGGALSNLTDPGSSQLPDGTLEQVSALPDVESAIGLLGFPSAIATTDGVATELEINSDPPAAIVGADLNAATSVYEIVVAAGKLPAAGELLVPAPMAAELGIATGETVSISSPTGRHDVRVSGILAEEGVGRLDTVAFTDMQTAATLAGRSALSQIVVKLAADRKVDGWLLQNDTKLGSGISMQQASFGLDFAKSQVATITIALSVVGFGVMIAGAFLIYLTLSSSIAERVKLLGILSALGATRRQLSRGVLSEAAAIGAAGVVAGIPLGIVLAWGLSSLASRLLDMLGSSELVVRPSAIVTGIVVGLGTTLVAALLPARRAYAADAIAAMRDEPEMQTASPRSAIPSIVAFAAGIGVVLVGSGATVMMAGMVLLIGGAVTAVTAAMPHVARLLRPALARLLPGMGDVITAHLMRERFKGGSVLAMVTLVIAVTISVAAVFVSFGGSMDRQASQRLGNDLTLTAASAFTPAFLEAATNHPALEGVTPVSEATATMKLPDGTDEPVGLVGVEPDGYFALSSFAWRDGDDETAHDALAAGGAVVLPYATARRLDVDRGDTVELATTSGSQRFTVAGTAAVPSAMPTLYLSARDVAVHFGSSEVTELLANAPGGDVEAARLALEKDLAPLGTFIVSTAAEIKQDIRAQVVAGIGGFFVLLLLAGVVGLFGLANTMVITISRRSREIGVLRAVGANVSQVRGMAVVEGIVVVAAAAIFGVPLGAAMSRPLVAALNGGIGDLTVDYSFPWAALPIVLVAALVAAALASLGPAHRAGKLDIDAVVRFE